MNTQRRHFFASSAGLAMAAALPWTSTARAAAWPDKPVRFYVPYPPGAATDTLGRMAAQVYGQQFNQTFVVENRGGGGTTIGTRAVATAAPDGYSIGIVDSTFTINPGLLGSRLPYDTLKDFAPISLMATAPFVMVVNPSVPAKDLAAFLALAKAQPGSLSFGSAGVGSAPHLAGEQLKQEAGVQLLHVPYRGGGTVFTDLLGGQVQFAFATVPTLLEHIKAGRLRALAVTTQQRLPQLPDVPTFKESGLPGVDTTPLFGVLAPAGTPRDIIERLSSTLAQSVRQGELHGKLTGLGFDPVGSTPAEFDQRIRAEVAKWTAVIQKGGIKAE
ncbi:MULTISPECIES: tripartite tricarboxylate transporter substrate binding protein [unclassified Achromobacter]|uniref:Bug family tripartite tricarboxylate transporter substrate binding protein n=1 Tax=unclassified Achromobacter TaxID=2626865 RepID=UPI000B51D040|nr:MULTISPECIES: tripartite tricarboxylate transporter substrate binding protein [unclassified Achromobacter]OWT80450.1 twin-arginine translocation pathway signal protein [Achromobacter sp. HZ34]OWT82333.1 twin-arginine translocation pathway signal protein [Achromobacter sp. HZ28]